MGLFPHLLPIDNGDYHGALQDLHVGFRYNVRAHPFMLTPFLAVAFPSYHYEHFAHSAVGTDLWEVQIGMNVGKRFAPLLPNAFLQMRYSYAMVQRVDVPIRLLTASTEFFDRENAPHSIKK